MTQQRLLISIMMAVSLLIAGCQTTSNNSSSYSTYNQRVVKDGYIQKTRMLDSGSMPDGTGMVAGAVIGGVLGNTIGGGSGRTLATVGGAAAGAYVGNQIQKNNRKQQLMEVTVRFKSGETGVYNVDPAQNLRAGDPVRVTIDGQNVQLMRR